MMHLEALDARTLFDFGTLDTTFGDDGHVSPTPAEVDYVRAQRTIVLSDGKMVVAGLRGEGDNRRWAVRRYLPNGEVDKTFGDDGKFSFGNLVDEVGGIAFLGEAPDGGLFIAGKGKLPSEEKSAANTVLVAKLTPTGTIDRNFLAFGASNVHRPGFVRLSDGVMTNVRGGKLMVASNSAWNSVETLISRYKPNGQLDKSFGTGGRLSGIDLQIPTEPIDPPGMLPFSYRGNAGFTALAEAPDGSTVAAGYYVYARGAAAEGPGYVSASLPYFVRISATGQVINTKVYTLDINKGQTSHYRGLSVAPKLMRIADDGKIYVHGNTGVIVRLNPDFSLDTTWSDDGIASVIAPDADPRIGEFTANLADMEVQADGGVLGVVMGSLRPGGASADDPILIRFRADGTTEAAATLDAPRTAVAAAPGTTDHTLNAVELAADGTVLVAGEGIPLARVFLDGESRAGRSRNTVGAADHATDAVVTGVHAASGYKFGSVWHDGRTATASSIDDGDLHIVTPGGGRFSARVISRIERADGSILVRYRTCRGASASPQSGPATLYVLGSRIADVAGALAAGRTLASFSVHVSQPALGTAEVAVGLSRDRAHEERVLY